MHLEWDCLIYIQQVNKFYLGCGYYDNNTDGIIGIQKEINEIAYPDGSYSRSVVDFADKLGIKYQLAARTTFTFDEDEKDKRLRTRNGIYQIGSWNSQINFKLH